ncbi:MAG: N-acetylneuraminate synthase family protein [Candidatus Wolfebacteria bacterium]|nr:N-acetylneuraminate synthase family protein [Candidatus Wolfebacteria bacterium]
MRIVKIGPKLVGEGQPVFVIAEIGINHNGDIDITKQLIDAAVEAGCDAVKFQKRTIEVVYTSEELARPRENPFGVTNGDLKRGLEFGKDEYDEIHCYCEEKGIMWFASPWDEQSVDFLEQYNPPCYKIASATNTDRELLEYVKSKGRQVIVSTGMSDDKMIEKIVDTLGEDGLVILHCTSTYPSKDSELHLNNIPRLINEFPRAIIGYSGHEVGAYASLVAATLGARVVERHITLDRAMWGSDQAASLEVGGLVKLTKELRSLPTYLGNHTKEILETEIPIAKKLRRKETLLPYYVGGR